MIFGPDSGEIGIRPMAQIRQRTSRTPAKLGRALLLVGFAAALCAAWAVLR